MKTLIFTCFFLGLTNSVLSQKFNLSRSTQNQIRVLEKRCSAENKQWCQGMYDIIASFGEPRKCYKVVCVADENAKDFPLEQLPISKLNAVDACKNIIQKPCCRKNEKPQALSQLLLLTQCLLDHKTESGADAGQDRNPTTLDVVALLTKYYEAIVNESCSTDIDKLKATAPLSLFGALASFAAVQAHVNNTKLGNSLLEIALLLTQTVFEYQNRIDTETDKDLAERLSFYYKPLIISIFNSGGDKILGLPPSSCPEPPLMNAIGGTLKGLLSYIFKLIK